MRKIIVIDPGHGGWDPGRIAIDGVPEAVSNWRLSLAIADALQKTYDVDVVFTHEGADTSCDPGNLARELAGRSWVANSRHADLLLSIHHDGHEDPSVRGASLWVWTRKNAPTGGLVWLPALDGLPGQNHTDPKSIPIARAIVSRIRNTLMELGVPWRWWGDVDGIACSNFGVLRNTQGPAVLLEAYHGTNPADVAAARRPEFVATLAATVADSLAGALGLPRLDTWKAPKCKIILPDGRVLWGELRDGATYAVLPGTTIEQAIRPVAEAMGRTPRFTNNPPTVTFE